MSDRMDSWRRPASLATTLLLEEQGDPVARHRETALAEEDIGVVGSCSGQAVRHALRGHKAGAGLAVLVQHTEASLQEG